MIVFFASDHWDGNICTAENIQNNEIYDSAENVKSKSSLFRITALILAMTLYKMIFMIICVVIFFVPYFQCLNLKMNFFPRFS